MGIQGSLRGLRRDFPVCSRSAEYPVPMGIQGSLRGLRRDFPVCSRSAEVNFHTSVSFRDITHQTGTHPDRLLCVYFVLKRLENHSLCFQEKFLTKKNPAKQNTKIVKKHQVCAIDTQAVNAYTSRNFEIITKVFGI